MDKISLYIHKYATPVLPKGDPLQSVRKNLRIDERNVRRRIYELTYHFSNFRLKDKVV